MAGRDPYRAKGPANELFETVWDSYRAILEGTLASHERNLELTRNVFEGGIETLRAQAELNRRTARELGRRTREQREVSRGIARDFANAYGGFLGSPSDHHRDPSEKRGEDPP